MRLSPNLDRAYTGMALLFWLGIIGYLMVWTQMTRPQFAVIFVGGSVVLYLVSELPTADDGSFAPSGRYLDLVLLGVVGVITVVTTVYVFQNYEILARERIYDSYWYEYVMATAFIGSIGYLVYREYGWALVLVGALSFVYAYFGIYFPSVFRHAGMNYEHMLHISMLEIEGIYGNLVIIVATWVAMFMLFSGLVQGYGAFDLILRGALKVAEHVKSGVAQSAVISSMIIGSINGSSVANAGITGSITIDLMRRSGIKPRTAAAIEAVASTGGQVIPPVMGAAAFLMASLLVMPFSDIVVAALVPAALFYVTVAFAIAVTIENESAESDPNLADLVDLEERTRLELALSSLQFLVPLGVLLYLLLVLQYTLMYTAFLSVVAVVIMSFVIPMLLEPSLDTVKEYVSMTLEGARIGARITAPIVLAVALINVTVDLFMATGVPNALALALVDLTGGVFLLTVVIALLISVLLGLGMPTVAAYVIVALLIAPAIVNEFAVPELAVHFFVFYGAILSAITPPIAVAVVVTSGLAGSDFWKTSLKAMKLGIALFVLPFFIVFQPEIVDPTWSLDKLLTIGVGIVGILAIAWAINKQYEGGRTLGRTGGKVVYALAGLGTIAPYPITYRASFVVVILFVYLLVDSDLDEGVLTAMPKVR